ncbi:RNA-binding protein 44-like [Melanerpes formicivorus]
MEFKKKSNVESKPRCFNQTSQLFSYTGEAEWMLVRDVAPEANQSGFVQACSANVSVLNVSEENLPYLSSSLDADIEMYNTMRMRICCAQAGESKEAGMLGRRGDNMHCDCGVCDDCRQSCLGEDSQLQYLSAHEQDFDKNSSHDFSEQREATGIETLKCIDPFNEVPKGRVTQEHSLIEVSEDCCSSECGAGDQTCPESAMPELADQLQDSLFLPDSNDMTCKHQEEQTEYHSIVCESLLESHSCGRKERVYPSLLVCDSVENGEVKDIPLSGEKNDRHVCRISVKQDGPFLSPVKRASAAAMQLYECAGHSDFYSSEELGVCAHGDGCLGCTAKGVETQFPVAEILTTENPFFEVEVGDKSSCGNTSFLSSGTKCREALKHIHSDFAVNQAVDASSDFRACFTTSRSSSAQVSLSSRAVNTEITMMNKSRPMGCHYETHTDIACNTEWSWGASGTEKVWSQLTEVLGERSEGDAAAAKRRSQIQEQEIPKNEFCSSSVKRNTDRLIDLDKQAVKNSVSSHCQKLLQRAIEAELQILKTHYYMCCQHCLRIYKLALEEKICFGRCVQNAELRSSVTLVLEGLKKKYNIMRMHINRGVPLNALPPLSVEIKLLQISSSYVPCELFKHNLCYNSVSGINEAGFKASKPQERNTNLNKDNPQTLCFTDGHQPRDSASSKTFEKQHKDQDVKCGIERDDYWFEAKEDLTAADSSVISEKTKKQQENQDTAALRDTKTMERGHEDFIPVSGPSSLVSEGDLRSNVQKNQISETLTSVTSSNYSSQRHGQDKTLTSASSSAKAPNATSASEKMHLLPGTTSDPSCFTQVPSETKCPDLKSSTKDLREIKKDTGENFLQKTSAPFSAHSRDAFVLPNTLNLSSFNKLMRKLKEMHPEASRDKIVDALLEVRENNKGVLSGLSIHSIVERTSVVLRKSTPSSYVLESGAELRRAWGRIPPRRRAGCTAVEMALLPRRFLCFVLAHHFIAATACQEADYGWMIRHYCLKQFQLSMEGIGQRLWCDWDETVGTYGELTNCTALIAERLDCYWPNRLVDEFFVAVHKQYFRNCSPSGRALHDPPNSILCPFILLPVLVTLLMTALVVWRSKRSEGIV